MQQQGFCNSRYRRVQPIMTESNGGSYSAFCSLGHSLLHTCLCCCKIELSLVALAAQRILSTYKTRVNAQEEQTVSYY